MPLAARLYEKNITMQGNRYSISNRCLPKNKGMKIKRFFIHWCGRRSRKTDLSILMTEFTTCTLVEFTTESLLHEVVETVTERFELHVVDHLIDEGVLQ